MSSIAVGLSLIAVAQVLRYIGQRHKLHHHYTRLSRPPAIAPTDIVLAGNNTGITGGDVERILMMRFPYFRSLAPAQQYIFLSRLQKFMQGKIFIIKDNEGYKEMPVLTSAAAIQLTFGLRHYRLPFYKYIRIYPEEYFGENLKVLAGNVQDNTISVAWNHLLKGIENPRDGANVGLHEMSHALYIQKIVIEEKFAKGFRRKYNHLLTECREAYDDEIKGHVDLYSNYATTNLQEFWAESVELFFEKPAELQAHFPDVYNAMKALLNQDPLNKENPIIKKELFRFY